MQKRDSQQPTDNSTWRRLRETDIMQKFAHDFSSLLQQLFSFFPTFFNISGIREKISLGRNTKKVYKFTLIRSLKSVFQNGFSFTGRCWLFGSSRHFFTYHGRTFFRWMCDDPLAFIESRRGTERERATNTRSLTHSEKKLFAPSFSWTDERWTAGGRSRRRRRRRRLCLKTPTNETKRTGEKKRKGPSVPKRRSRKKLYLY